TRRAEHGRIVAQRAGERRVLIAERVLEHLQAAVELGERSLAGARIDAREYRAVVDAGRADPNRVHAAVELERAGEGLECGLHLTLDVMVDADRGVNLGEQI